MLFISSIKKILWKNSNSLQKYFIKRIGSNGPQKNSHKILRMVLINRSIFLERNIDPYISTWFIIFTIVDIGNRVFDQGAVIRSNFLRSTIIFDRRFRVKIEDFAQGQHESWELEFFVGTNFLAFKCLTLVSTC